MVLSFEQLGRCFRGFDDCGEDANNFVDLSNFKL